jgi:hypothetical protein
VSPTSTRNTIRWVAAFSIAAAKSTARAARRARLESALEKLDPGRRCRGVSTI